MRESEVPAVVDGDCVDRASVVAVVVAYDSASTMERCILSLQAQPEIIAIRVIDNGSRDDTVTCIRALAARDARIVLIELPHNPGFAAGCNAGAAGVTRPWLLFVNPDLELPEGALARLLAHATALPKLGVLGVDLRDAEGRHDPAARRHDLSLARIVGAAGARTGLTVPVDESLVLQRVDACSGALMLVPRAAFEAIDGFDVGYRLHVEDLDFCRRLRAAGFMVAVANDVVALHHRGVSSRARPFFVEWHKHRGLWRYWRRFRGNGAALVFAPLVFTVLVLRLLLLALPRAVLRRLR